MRRLPFSMLAALAFIQFILVVALSPQTLAQEWQYRKARGTLKVVDLWVPSASAMLNYAEGLLTADIDNKPVACLAEDWRWIDDRTIEFKLRRGATFHNGEKFNAEAVRMNWEEYRRMKIPRPVRCVTLPDELKLRILDDYTVQFTFPEPDALALVKFQWFYQFAPAFFAKHKFEEGNHGYLPEAGPWGTGPFELVEGDAPIGRPSARMVLEAFEGYWDRRFPKVQRIIFENTLIGDREEAMRLCREEEGGVDLVSHIRPLDTLKVAESPFAKVVKSKDLTWLVGRFNQLKRESKWNDIRLRKALNYAINREELWKYAAKGNAYNLEAIFPPAGVFGHNPDLTPWPYDTDRARSLLTEAGYPEGLDVNIITTEASKLEAKIISKMLERVALRVKLEVLTWPEYLQKTWIPAMDKPPDEQEWDISLFIMHDMYGHVAPFFAWDLMESPWRTMEYDPVYEEMWKEFLRTVNPRQQEEKIRKIAEYFYDHASGLNIYCPMMLYAVNKEVNFIPHKSGFLRLKETSVTDKHWSIREENE
jgi:peptide/nickel transport system substrate-binding protein